MINLGELPSMRKLHLQIENEKAIENETAFLDYRFLGILRFCANILDILLLEVSTEGGVTDVERTW